MKEEMLTKFGAVYYLLEAVRETAKASGEVLAYLQHLDILVATVVEVRDAEELDDALLATSEEVINAVEALVAYLQATATTN